MHILYYYITATAFTASWPQYHYIDELRRHGHKITIINPLSFPSIDLANEELLCRVKNNLAGYDLFINSYGEDLLYVDTIRQISRHCSIPTLLICFDNLQAPYIHRKVAPYFDLIWLTSYETEPLFRRWGCRCIFLPYAANPYVFQPCFSNEINTVGFIGTPYGTRILKINDLLAQNIPCSVFSSELNFQFNISRKWDREERGEKKTKISTEDWSLMKFSIGRRILWSKWKKKRMGCLQLLRSQALRIYPSVSFHEMNRLYSNFSLSLSITEVWDTYLLHRPVHKIHLRTFEIPMCGGLQFAPYIEELSNYFEDGKEIVLYRTKEEYNDKARFYLRADKSSLRMQMKYAARKRAENDHTWINRFDKAFLKLNS